MRFLALAGTLALVGVAACSSGGGRAPFETGVGFGDYQAYLRERASGGQAFGRVPYSVPPETSSGASRAAITPPASMPAEAPRTVDAIPVRAMPPAPQPIVQPAPAVQPLPPIEPAMQPLAQPLPPVQPAPQPIVQATQPAGAPLSAMPATTVATAATFGTTPAFNAGTTAPSRISDEQDFNAVAARETIESDRERLARQREQYQVIQVTSVPDSNVSAGPNLVAYALSTNHPVGTETYRRINPLRWSRWQDACLQFRTQDAAQAAFLSSGGPERDRDNLDPDGDGYACWWDPTPLRQAVARN